MPDVFAAGHVANLLHAIFGRVRVEHFNNAEKQGRAVARAVLGNPQAYEYIYSFWSDQAVIEPRSAMNMVLSYELVITGGSMGHVHQTETSLWDKGHLS